MKHKIFRNIMTGMLVMSLGISLAAPAEVMAGIHVTTQNGIADMGDGDASIILSGNHASQNLTGKSFHLYQLFYAENAANLESIQYTFHESCKEALQTVVGERLHKAPERCQNTR